MLGDPDGNKIVRIILSEGSIRTNELMSKSKIPSARFHLLMKALVVSHVLDKKVHQDRSVSYSISPFGKNILDLSEPLLKKIKVTFKNTDSALISAAQQRKI